MKEYWSRNREGLGVNILATVVCALAVYGFWYFHDAIPSGGWRTVYWIGAGAFGLLGFVLFFVPFGAKDPRPAPRPDGEAARSPSHWDKVRPPQSRFETVTETATSIPLRQSCSYEYSPTGDAYPLRLRGGPARVIIQFTCRVLNPYKAMFHAGEYAMNVLPPKFLEQARQVLEKHSAKRLRDDREAVAATVRESATPLFAEHGYVLESVTIGDVEPLRRGR